MNLGIQNNKKGQALVEFVIILPIFIFMLLAIIDIGKVIYNQNRLESEMSSVVELYRNEKSYAEILDELSLNDESVTLDVTNEENETVTFSLKKEVTIVTPGLNLLFSNPYEIEVTRVIYYE